MWTTTTAAPGNEHREIIMTVVAAAEAVEAVEAVEVAAAGAGSEAGVGGLLSKLKSVGNFVAPLKSVAGAFMSLGDSADEASKKVERTFTKPLAEIDTFSGKIKSVTDVNFDVLAGQALQLADNIHDVSAQTGIAAEDLSVLNAAAGDNGMKLDALAQSLGTFNSSINDALGGDSKMLETFNRLGVSWDDLRSKSPRDLLLETANGLAGITDPATRAAAAHEIFAEKSQELLPTLVGLAGDGFRKTAEEAAMMARIVGGTTADAADQFDKNLLKVKGSLVGAALSILNVMMPAITALSGVIVTVTENLGAFINFVVRGIPAVISAIGSTASGIGGTFKTLGSAIKEAWQGDHDVNILGRVQAQINQSIAAGHARVQEIMTPPAADILRPEYIAKRTPLHQKATDPGTPATAAGGVHIDMPSYHSTTHTQLATSQQPHPDVVAAKEELQLLPQVVSHMKEKLEAARAAAEVAERERTTVERTAEIEALRAHAIVTTTASRRSTSMSAKRRWREMRSTPSRKRTSRTSSWPAK